MKRGKKWVDARKNIDRMREYPLKEAVESIKQNATAKFGESFDIAVNLGVDPRKSDQHVRSTVVLPHGIGKAVRVLVFAQGEKAEEAEKADADFVGGDEIAEKIKGGWMEFDAVVAEPSMMKVVGKLGKILGPRGLMPNPKLGTVTTEIGKAVEELKMGKVEFRVEKAGILHASVGTLSFETQKLVENVKAFIAAVLKMKPSAAKGRYIKKVTLSSTMGQGLKVDLSDLS